MTVELRSVTRMVGAETHIHETTLVLEPAGFNVLLGATGAGKTTLMKLMAGLDRPTTGRVLIDGRDVTDLSPQKRGVSFVHQFFVNYPHMTVFDNIASPLRVTGVAKSEIAGRVEEAARLLQLTPMLKRRPQELSGGQQQRTALARAIVKDSRALFLDEPLANLDYKLREELRDQLPDIFAGRGAVVVYATSEPEEALLLGGRTALMDEGRVVQFGPSAGVYRAPVSLTAARVFSNPPINAARVTKAGAEVRLTDAVRWAPVGRAAGLADGTYTVAIRPSDVLPFPGPGARVAMRGRVLITELTGSESSAHFDLGGQNWVSLAHGVHPYEVGSDHTFYMDPARCFYFGPDGSVVA